MYPQFMNEFALISFYMHFANDKIFENWLTFDVFIELAKKILDFIAFSENSFNVIVLRHHNNNKHYNKHVGIYFSYLRR